MFSALANNHGDLNSKLSLFVAIGPCATWKFQQPNNKDGLRLFSEALQKTCETNKVYELKLDKAI